jgi:hypothetical protein
MYGRPPNRGFAMAAVSREMFANKSASLFSLELSAIRYTQYLVNKNVLIGCGNKAGGFSDDFRYITLNLPLRAIV